MCAKYDAHALMNGCCSDQPIIKQASQVGHEVAHYMLLNKL